jgi:hypothetical protein
MKNEAWFGKVVRWRDGGRLYAKNDFVTMVYVATDDSEKVGQLGLHGSDQMVVKFIDQATADKWPINQC